jgi:hypothetical protein
MKRTKAKLYLERFIKSPSEKTLYDFLISCDLRCIYMSCVNPRRLCQCPNQCIELSQERLSVFDKFLCSTSAYEWTWRGAWKKHSAELTLHLIRFNSYIESVLNQMKVAVKRKKR